MSTSAYQPIGPTVEIRPGVFRPDWTAVTRQRARDALFGRLAARAGLLDKWSLKLETREDTIWRNILRHYADHGQPPKLTDIATETGIAADDVATVLQTLQSHDLIGLDPHLGSIRLAYPFTQAATGHTVELRGHVLNALCAIDALGVAAMYGTDLTISSPCRYCGAKVHVTTAAKGEALCGVNPNETVVWYDFAYEGNAAASCCPAIVFFCSGDHRQQWLDDQVPRRTGVGLTVDEALEVGRAIFGPVLVE